MSVLDLLADLSPAERTDVLDALTDHERVALTRLVDELDGVGWARYATDPVGFVIDGLGETVWSKQRQILESLRDNKRTAVPACHAPGKSHIAARAVAWWIAVHPPGTARVVTTASTFRQVKGVLWPSIRRVAARYDLPGEVFTTEWQIDGIIVADGFSPAEYNDTAVQGIHAPHLLVVVDEAGGIGPNLGRALEALMTGDHTRLLVLGNPPVDRDGSWFERLCESPLYEVIPISAYDTPNFTGEDAGVCKACPPETPEHQVATHLVDHGWVREVISEFGEDSAFVEARVNARFPSVVASKVIPLAWLEQSAEQDPKPQGDIRLGIDVASDGGDEFVVARADGMNVEVIHWSAGDTNASAVDVSGKAMEFVRQAVAEHAERGNASRVRVKIDSIGVGWGVASLLTAWCKEQRVAADIISVNVAERARDAKFHNQRAELWWNGRQLVTPDEQGVQDLRVVADRKTLAQMSAPMYSADSGGRILIEKKDAMKKRGVGSPDRAEAILLAVYEPPGFSGPIPAPVGIGRANPWAMPT